MLLKEIDLNQFRLTCFSFFLFRFWFSCIFKNAMTFECYLFLSICKSISLSQFISPTPNVEWVKMSHQLPVKAKQENHGKFLIVPRVEQEDSGKYMCKARNALGEVASYFTVTVEGK